VKVILDTCVWSRFLRRNRSESDAVAAEVARLVRADVVQLIGPIRQELLSGARPTERFEQLKEYLRFFPNLHLDEADDETAASFSNRLRERGIQGADVDLIICAAAVRRGLKIFTTDGDFTDFAKHIPIKLHQFRGKAS
jgi:predicted nucleic acid-binding protein